ncbi:MAG: hypothetical protein QOD53_1501 [Thermoleophilaceae bacterium]|nr:hypothetical protein [Thermoleophilaceae bacterium]
MDEDAAIPQHDQTEEPRHLPVLAAEARVIDRQPESQLSAPVAAATGGFLAGIAAFVLLRALRASPRRFGILPRRKSPAERALEIAASRSFLVDVHVVKR